jgi:hypothetical protein
MEIIIKKKRFNPSTNYNYAGYYLTRINKYLKKEKSYSNKPIA